VWSQVLHALQAVQLMDLWASPAFRWLVGYILLEEQQSAVGGANNNPYFEKNTPFSRIPLSATDPKVQEKNSPQVRYVQSNKLAHNVVLV